MESSFAHLAPSVADFGDRSTVWSRGNPEAYLLALSSQCCWPWNPNQSLVGRTVDLKVLDKLGLRAHAEGFMIDGFHTRGRSISRAQLARFLVENDSTGKA